jgi:hypothetical protein
MTHSTSHSVQSYLGYQPTLLCYGGALIICVKPNADPKKWGEFEKDFYQSIKSPLC